jgi:hypothetical protein
VVCLWLMYRRVAGFRRVAMGGWAEDFRDVGGFCRMTSCGRVGFRRVGLCRRVAGFR